MKIIVFTIFELQSHGSSNVFNHTFSEDENIYIKFHLQVMYFNFSKPKGIEISDHGKNSVV